MQFNTLNTQLYDEKLIINWKVVRIRYKIKQNGIAWILSRTCQMVDKSKRVSKTTLWSEMHRRLSFMTCLKGTRWLRAYIFCRFDLIWIHTGIPPIRLNPLGPPNLFHPMLFLLHHIRDTSFYLLTLIVGWMPTVTLFKVYIGIIIIGQETRPFFRTKGWIFWPSS